MKNYKASMIMCIVFAVIFAAIAVWFGCIPAETEDASMTKTVMVAVVAVFAGCFVIAAIVSFFGIKRQRQRYEMIAANLSQMECHAQFIAGAFNAKGAAGKAAAKTAASVIGGFFMAFFFGFGAYKIYGANNAAEFVLTDGGLFFGPPSKGGVNLNGMTFISNGSLPATLTVKKNYVLMKNAANGDVFTFNTKSAGIPSEQFAERLNAFLHPSKAAAAAAAADPFNESNNAAVAQSSAPQTADAAAEGQTEQTAEAAVNEEAPAEQVNNSDDPFSDL